MRESRAWRAARAYLWTATDNRHTRIKEPTMLARLLRRATATSRTVVQAPRHRLMAATKPAAAMLVVDALIDLARDMVLSG